MLHVRGLDQGQHSRITNGRSRCVALVTSNYVEVPQVLVLCMRVEVPTGKICKESSADD